MSKGGAICEDIDEDSPGLEGIRSNTVPLKLSSKIKPKLKRAMSFDIDDIDDTHYSCQP